MAAAWKSIFPCPQFITTTFPLIAENTIILGVCTSDLEASHPEEDGWFVSDFYAFNYLLHGLGSPQTWLSAVSPTDLLRRYGSFFHGNPYKPRHAVLTDTLLNEGKITEPTVLPRGSIREGVLSYLATLSELSHQTDSPLLILVFGHRQDEDKSIIIEYDFHRLTKGEIITDQLTIEDLRRATSQAKHVSLISTACFSGGWTVIPDLNVTIAADASAEIASLSWLSSSNSGRRHGSIFASSALCFLTDQTGLTEDMPTFNSMYSLMVDNLSTCFKRFPETHEFTFSAYNNDDGGVFPSFSALPARDFEAHWNALEIAPPVEPSTTELDTANPLLTNDDYSQHMQQDTESSATESMRRHRHQHLPPTPSLFGGTFRSQMRFTKHVAMSHMATCQGDWEMSLGGKHGGILHSYLRDPCPDQAATQQALHLIEWRNSVMELADTWVAMLQLPRPAGGKVCAYWDRRIALRGQEPSAQSRMGPISGLLRAHGLEELIPETHDCEFNTTCIFSCGRIPFSRPRCYIAACMALAGLQDAEVTEALERCKAIYLSQ
jgi:hypothetical protein